jgi:hypothetical protein
MRMGQQMMEMAVAVPQVVAHRMTRMALASPTPSARDQREFKRMSDEKVAAFQESWVSMGMQAAMAQQRLWVGMMGALPWPWGSGRMPDMSAALAKEGQGVLDKGFAPVHRRAVANAKRLGRTRLK